MAEPIALTGRKAAKEVKGFGCGAVVRLKGGSIHLTVRKSVSSEEAMVTVDWFNADEDYMTADFYVAELDRVEPLPPDGDAPP